MKNPQRYVSKVTGNGKVVIDNSTRTAYSGNSDALKGSAYFMYKKVVLDKMDEVEVVQYNNDISYNLEGVAVTVEEDIITVTTATGITTIHDGEHHYTALATLVDEEADLSDMVVSILRSKELTAKPINIMVIYDATAVNSIEPTATEEVVEEEKVEIPVYDLAELDDVHIPRYDVYVVTGQTPQAPYRPEIVASEIRSSVQHLTGTGTKPYSINTSINKDTYRYRIVTKEDIVNVLIDTRDGSPITNEIVHSIIEHLKVINIKSNLVNFISVTPSDYDIFDSVNADRWEATINTVARCGWCDLDVEDGQSFKYGDVDVATCYTEYGIVNKVEDSDPDLEIYSPETKTVGDIITHTATFGTVTAYALKRDVADATPLFIVPIKGVPTAKLQEILRVLIQLSGLRVRDHFCLLSVDEAAALNSALISNLTKDEEMENSIEQPVLWFSEADHIRLTTDSEDSGIHVNHIFKLLLPGTNNGEFFKLRSCVTNDDSQRYYNIALVEFTSSRHSVAGTVLVSSLVSEGTAIVHAVPLAKTVEGVREIYELLEADELIGCLDNHGMWERHDGLITDYVVAFALDVDTSIISAIESAAGVTHTIPMEDWVERIYNTAGITTGDDTVDEEEEVVEDEDITMEIEGGVAAEEPDFIAPIVEEELEPATEVEGEVVFEHNSTGEENEIIPTVEETETPVMEEKEMSGNKPFIQVAVAAHLVNYTGVEVESNVAVIAPNETVDEESKCVGVIIDFNDYFKAVELMAQAEEKGQSVYQLRYLDGGASNEVIRLK